MFIQKCVTSTRITGSQQGRTHREWVHTYHPAHHVQFGSEFYSVRRMCDKKSRSMGFDFFYICNTPIAVEEILLLYSDFPGEFSSAICHILLLHIWESENVCHAIQTKIYLSGQLFQQLYLRSIKNERYGRLYIHSRSSKCI